MRSFRIWIALCTLNFAVAYLFDAATQPKGIYYLDFSGGSVRLNLMYPLRTSADLRIPQFKGDKAAVLEAVRDDFARWPGVRIEMGESREHPDGNVVFVGDMDATGGLLGIAERVDVGDASQDDRAVVFAASIASSSYGSPPDERLQTLANVVSHEIGHLLGFSHTRFRDDIMVQGLFRADRAFRLHQQSYVDRRSLWWACAGCTRDKKVASDVRGVYNSVAVIHHER